MNFDCDCPYWSVTSSQLKTGLLSHTCKLTPGPPNFTSPKMRAGGAKAETSSHSSLENLCKPLLRKKKERKKKILNETATVTCWIEGQVGLKV